MLEKTLLFKTLRSALESYKFQFNSMKSLFIISGDSGQIPLELWPSWRHEVNVISSVTWRLPSRRIRSAICCQILSSTRNIYLRLPLLTLLDMRPGMYSYPEVHSLDLHVAWNDSVLALRFVFGIQGTHSIFVCFCSAAELSIPLLGRVLRPTRSRPIPRGGSSGIAVCPRFVVL